LGSLPSILWAQAGNAQMPRYKNLSENGSSIPPHGYARISIHFRRPRRGTDHLRNRVDRNTVAVNCLAQRAGDSAAATEERGPKRNDRSLLSEPGSSTLSCSGFVSGPAKKMNVSLGGGGGRGGCLRRRKVHIRTNARYRHPCPCPQRLSSMEMCIYSKCTLYP
jgi:hypothetical protein